MRSGWLSTSDVQAAFPAQFTAWFATAHIFLEHYLWSLHTDRSEYLDAP